MEIPGIPLKKPRSSKRPDPDSKAYSWGKAPRYDGHPAETGPLAELVMAGNPLIKGFLEKDGPNVFLRQLARLIRPALLFPVMDMLAQGNRCGKRNLLPEERAPKNGRGFGLVQAHRGALGHWVTLEDGKIAEYQVITPDGLECIPRDKNGIRGPWEEALMGTVASKTRRIPSKSNIRSVLSTPAWYVVFMP